MRGSGPKLLYIILAAGGIIAVLSSSGIRTIARLNEKIRSVESRIEAVKEDNTRLRQELDWIENEDYLEYLARTRLGFIKPGETKYYILLREPE